MDGAEERRSGQTNEQSSTDKLFADSIYVYTPRSVQARPEAKTHAAPPPSFPRLTGERRRYERVPWLVG